MPSTRRLAAILFADIVGYTALMQHDEKAALEKLHHFKEELNEKVNSSGGQIIQYYGDGCLAIFNNPTDAVFCSKTLQEKFRTKVQIPVRIGIHLGEILVEDGHIFGDSVNIAARIQSMSVPGGVLFSDAIKNQIKNKPEFQFISLGRFEFKNVDEEMEVFALSNPGFPVPDKSSLEGKFKESLKQYGKPESNKRKLLLTGILVAVLASSIFFLIKNFSGSGASTTQAAFSEKNNRSIAVLPFADMSPDKSQEYLGDGLADDIISALSGIDSLKVIGRTSSFQYKGKNVDLREIGDKLGVETVLEGSVQKAGNTLRITAQLIKVEDGSHIWSHKWDRDMNDIFKVQDEIANGIKEKLKVSFLAASRKTPTVNTEAYESFLKGRRLLLTMIPENVKLARNHFLDAIKTDSSFADAMAFLSLSYFRLGSQIYPWIEKERRQKAIDSAYHFAQKALALDDNSADAHLAMGVLFVYNYDWEKAEKEYRRAHELNPGTLEKNFLADFLGDIGEFDEAYKIAEEALVIDPLDINSMIAYSNVFSRQGRYKEAIQILEKVIKIDSTSMRAYAALGHCYHNIKKDKECLLAWARQHEINGNKELTTLYRKTDFKTAMKAWIKQAATPNAPFSSGEYVVALIYAYFLDKENTFKYLDLAVKNHHTGIINLKVNKAFDFLKDDPRYMELYRKLRFDKYDEYKSKKITG